MNWYKITTMKNGKKIHINYEREINRAIIYILWQVLKDASKNGLRENHYFYIKIDTTNCNFRIEDKTCTFDHKLLEKYPKEMTIVIQNSFDQLIVEKDYFTIILNFNSEPRKLTVPLSSIMMFSDPYAKFVVQLEHKKYDEEGDDFIEFDGYESSFADDDEEEDEIDSPLTKFLEYDYNIYKSCGDQKIVFLDDIRKKLRKPSL